MDAELVGTPNQTQTNPSVINTAQTSESVKVPHLLIWGISEGGMTSIQSAFFWAKHVQNNLARIDPFPYGHQWIGTNVEDRILSDILAFFNNQSLGNFNVLQTDYGPADFLTDSQLLTSNAYDAQRREYVFQIAGENDTVGSMNLAIPIASINGLPSVFFDQNSIPIAYSSDANDYHICFTYTHSTHTIMIAGQSDIPEFPANTSVVPLTMLPCMFIMIAAFSRKRTRQS